MQKEHDTIFWLAQRLCELQAEKGDAEHILKDINDDIVGTKRHLEEAMASHDSWLAVLVCMFKKRRKGGGADV